MKRFWVIPKITPSNLCKPMNDIINYSTSICPFESGKNGKEAEKNTKIWISRERKELFRWNKKHFSVFDGLSFGEKIKNWVLNEEQTP